jgi:hypothetical protein
VKGTWRIFSAEFYRLRRSRITWLAALFVFLIPALRVFAARLSGSAARLAAAREGRELLGLEEGRGWAPLVEGWRAGLALGALLILIHGARTIAWDRERGILRLAATRTAGRSAQLFGRALLGPVLVLSVVILSGLGAWLAANHWFEFGPLIEDDYLILTAGELHSELRFALLAALPPLLAVHAFGLLVSTISRGATIAVACSVALFLAFDLFKESLGDDRWWVFASYSPSFIDTSAMREMVGVAHGYSDAGFTAALMRMNLMVPWPQIALLLLAAAWILSRRRI